MDSFSKIIQILNLSSTDEREITHEELIIFILYLLNEKCEKLEIIDFINSEFGVTLIENEVDEAIDRLQINGKINKYGKKYELTDESKVKCVTNEKEAKEFENKIFEDFISIINEGVEAGDNINHEAIYDTYKKFLLEWIYIFGNETLNYFIDKPSEDFSRIIDFHNICTNLSSKPKELKLFREFIKLFPYNLSSYQLDYISNLCIKSESFYSLGLPKSLVEEFRKEGFLNWVIYLDTNVLYSILKLHYNRQNEVCNKIIDIINNPNNKINIKLKYFQKTREELLKKKDFFNESIPRIIYSESQIKALLKSEKLDSFSQMYLRSMLDHKGNTPHPTDILKNLTATLKSKNIEINRKDIVVDTNDEYFLDLISEYHKYEDIVNEAREAKGFETKPPKSVDKLDHDLLFRQNIKHFRILKPSTLNEAKYFGLSIDNNLISFDNYKSRKEPQTSDKPIPTIFYPRFLLFKLLRFLPLDTDDYKDSFIKMLSVPNISSNKDSRISSQALRSVAKFKAMGIENEDLILECITDDIFIKKLGSEVEFSENDRIIVENKYDLKIKELQNQIDEINDSLESERKEKENSIADSYVKEQKITSQKTTLDEYKELIRIFKNEFTKIKKQKDSFEQEEKKVPQQLELDSILNDQEQNNKPDENIINWKLFRQKSSEFYFSVTKLFEHGLIVLSVCNLLFALLLVIVSIVDKSQTGYYWTFSTLIGGVILIESFKKNEEKHKFFTSPWQLIVSLIYLIFLWTNYVKLSELIISWFSILISK